MMSYASVDRIEDGIQIPFAVLEVELNSVGQSEQMDILSKETSMMHIPMSQFTENGFPDVHEGDIFVVEHNGKDILKVCSKDEEEKQKRIAFMEGFY